MMHLFDFIEMHPVITLAVFFPISMLAAFGVLAALRMAARRWRDD